MIASKAFWTRFSVDKQEFLLKLVILSIAAILGIYSTKTQKNRRVYFKTFIFSL